MSYAKRAIVQEKIGIPQSLKSPRGIFINGRDGNMLITLPHRDVKKNWVNRPHFFELLGREKCRYALPDVDRKLKII